MKFAAGNPDSDTSLGSLAARAGLSRFHLHRVFLAMAGETPKRFTLRLRLERAAVMLLVGRESILDIALACGFQSHEAFTRSFRERFGMSPRAYRKRGFAGKPGVEEGKQHADFVQRVGPCLGLFTCWKEMGIEDEL